MASAMAAELTTWVTDEVKQALATCFAELYSLEGNGDAVLNFPGPVLLWDGKDGPYHDPIRMFAEANGFRLLSTPGDHLEAMTGSAAEVCAELKSFAGPQR